MSSLTILELSQAIAKDAAILDEHFRSQGLPQPSFDEDGPEKVEFQDVELANAHERLLSSTRELHHLAMGPSNSLRLALNSSLNAAALSAIHRLNVAKHVPLKGEIRVDALAEIVGVPTSDLKTVLRLAMTDHVFYEPSPGTVAHTAASKLLKENPLISAWIDIGVEEMFPASTKVAEAMLKHPGSEEPTLSGWSLENNATLPLFAELSARHPRRAENFGRAMEFMAAVIEQGAAARCMDWAGLGKGVVVDVGGGKGLAAIEIARAFPKLTFIVQDLEETVAQGRRQLPEDLKDRIDFTRHDFFTLQPVKNADVYYLRAVFHNWPDKYCIKILQNLIPALKSGARIVIQDPTFPEKGYLSPYQEQQAIASDLMMMAYFNAHNRETEEWPKLFAKADPRFRVQRVIKPGRQYPVERLATVEVIWEG